jgi:hypothetical protein
VVHRRTLGADLTAPSVLASKQNQTGPKTRMQTVCAMTRGSQIRSKSADTMPFGQLATNPDYVLVTEIGPHVQARMTI